MADTNSTTNQPCIVVQVPKTPAEVSWVEGAHGAESIVTVFGLLIGAWWAYRNDWVKTTKERADDRDLRKKEQEQRQDTLDQRDRQLRWDQAKLAKEINDQFLADRDAQNALSIVDADVRIFRVTTTEDPPKIYPVSIEDEEHIKALQVSGKGAEAKEIYIRECFDSWFYWMSIMEQYLKNKLVLQEDIAYPSDYYVRCLRDEQKLYDACVAYIQKHELSPNILAFVKRFSRGEPGTPSPVSLT
jgi:hypothetical protein